MVVDFPRCDNADTYYYVRMPKDPPPVDSKVGMQSKLCEEEGATLEPIFPIIGSHLSLWNGYVYMYVRLGVTPHLLAIFKMQQASLERTKEML